MRCAHKTGRRQWGRTIVCGLDIDHPIHRDDHGFVFPERD